MIREAQRRWNAKNPDYYKQYARKNAVKLRAKRRERYLKNVERLRKYSRDFRKSHPDLYRELKRAYRKKMPLEVREKMKATAVGWRRKNRKHIAERMGRYYLKNREKYYGRAKKYRDLHGDEIRACRRNRWKEYYSKHREQVLRWAKNHRVKYGPQIREWLRLYFRKKREALVAELWCTAKGICYLCHKSMNLGVDRLEADHFIPRKLNGPENISNLRLTHQSCNRRKSGKHPSELGVAA